MLSVAIRQVGQGVDHIRRLNRTSSRLHTPTSTTEQQRRQTVSSSSAQLSRPQVRRQHQ